MIPYGKDTYEKFVSFVDGLRPELKHQFLSRSFDTSSINVRHIENILEKMSPEDFQKIADLFSQHASLLPETLKNLIDKLTMAMKGEGLSFDIFSRDAVVVHDIEIGENLMKLFEEDHFKSYVNEDYKKDLDLMLKSPGVERRMLDEFRDEFRYEVIDRTVSEVFLELLNADFLSEDDYAKLILRFTDFINIFIRTGRFEELVYIYNTVFYSRELISKQYSHEIIEYFFHSDQLISELIESFKMWGRNKRDSVVSLARGLKSQIINPMLDALSNETDSSIRRFFLSVLVELGSDVLPHAVKRLRDNRWYVVRNILYLIRECEGAKYVEHVKKFTKHEHRRICIEAVKTLLYFKTNDAIPYLKIYLKSDNAELRTDAVKLAGLYRIKEAVPYLTALLDKTDIFSAESYYKVDIVRALGEIRDPEALEPLLKLYNTKGILYWKGLENLKVEIFKSLAAYPLHSVKPFIEKGLQSKNEEIRSISKELFKKLEAKNV